MPIIGVTGGIGSGKTTVCKMFETLGIPVYYADEAAKRLMQNEAEVVAAIRELFGDNTYNKEGKLDKSYLAKQVFNDKSKLEKLNAIVHPATIRDSIAWAQKQSAPYVLKEAALLFESDAFHYVDKVIGVFAPVTLRIHRTIKRSNITKEEVLQRMENQINEEVKMRLCDFIIVNDGQHALIPQVLDLHKQLIDSDNNSTETSKMDTR